MSEIKKETMENYLQLARDAVEQKDYDAATDHLISVLQMDSNNVDAYGIMGDMARSKKDYDTAENYYLRQLELAPQSYEAHNNLGFVYFDRSEYENAISEFKTAMQLDNDHCDPYLFLASIYYNLGKYEESYDYLNRLVFEVKRTMSESERDLYNQAYYSVSCTLNDNLSISDLDSLIQQIETKYGICITTRLVVNPDVPLMPFRMTGEKSYVIDYDLDSSDKFYEILSSLILIDNHIGGEYFDFHHFLLHTDDGKEEFSAMIRNTMDADSPLSMSDLLDYLVVDIRTTLIRIYTDEVIHLTPELKQYRAIHWLGMGNAIGQSYSYINKLERIHAPRLVIYVHKVLLYLKCVPLYEYYKCSDKRINFKSMFIEHKMGCDVYNDHVNMKDSAKRRDWVAFCRSFINQVCPVLRHYLKFEKIS